MTLNVSGQRVLGSGITFLVIGIFAVALRLHARISTKTKIAADDWLTCGSLIGYGAALGVELWGKVNTIVRPSGY